MKRSFFTFSTASKSAILLFVLAFVSIIEQGCSSGKENFVEKSYHDVTARDNAYFNANLLVQDAAQRLWDEQNDNYEEVLPVFKFGKEGAGKSVAADMDEAIKKCSFPIQLHENSKWIDDAYFVIGQAHFYKQDYNEALETFQYLISEYSDVLGGPKSSGKKRKRRNKKKRGRSSSKKKAEEEIPVQDQSFAWLKHAPRSHEASLWIARTLTQAGDFGKAQTALSVIRADEQFPVAMQPELEAVQAHLLLTQNKYQLAIEPLVRASELTKKRATRARYTFILAQLYARDGRAKEAIETYEKVLKLRPDYEMEFFARINMANIYRNNNLKSGKEIKNMLADLLKDEKNREYFGLIYYAMADIDLEGGREKEGIKNLNLSVRNAGADAQQKALSYLRIADINYDKEEFQTAFYYYDSCLATLEKQYIRYDEAKDRRDGLSGLVDHLDVIETEERLQYWAGLPERAREAEIEEWLIETQGEPEEEEEDEFFDPLNNRDEPTNSNVTASGQWYFYDAGARGAGFTEFKRRWGKRADDDNWRRSDRRTTEPTEQGGEGEEEGIQLTAEGTIDLNAGNLTIDDILEILPIEEEGKLASDDKIIRSLYATGNIYKEYLENEEKAIFYFEKLLKDYPDSEFRLKVLYNLYLLHSNTAQKEKYKKLILDEFPESIFAKVIIDPDYFVKLEQKDQEVKDFYAATFDLFEEEEYIQVRDRVKEAETRFTENPIAAHFALLDAMTYGEENKEDEFKIALQGVVNNHPDTDQSRRAQELLNYLRRGSVIKDRQNGEGGEQIYQFDASVEHFVCLIVNKTGREVTKLKNDVVDFNREFFSRDNLRVSSLLFESDKTIVLVKTFDNQDEGMKYYNAFSNDDIMTGWTADQFNLIVISRSNYTQLYRKKDLQGYIDFFNSFYLTDE